MSTDTEPSEASDQGESLTSNTGSNTDSLLLCDSLKVNCVKCVTCVTLCHFIQSINFYELQEFYVGMGDCDSGLDSECLTPMEF